MSGPVPAPIRTGHLKSARVRLRPPAPSDVPLLFGWLNDPDAIAPWDRFDVDSYSALEESIRSAPGDPRSLAPRFLIWVRSPDGRSAERPIGVVGFFSSYTALDTVDLWYAICVPTERGQGYGSEAASLLTDFVFSHRQVERVGATSDVENPASWKMLEGLGFRREGMLRRALFHHGGWHDVVVYGLIRSEWEALRAKVTAKGPSSKAPRARS